MTTTLASTMTTPEPECWLGYPQGQLQEILGEAGYHELGKWMYGQTMAICDGQRYDHDLQEYVQTCPEPHGIVVYVWDLGRFMANLPIID